MGDTEQDAQENAIEANRLLALIA
ncbi:hypothetical protein [Obesumbacterium proteus]